MKARGRGFLCRLKGIILFFSVLLLGFRPLPTPGQPSPFWWEIALELETQGEYRFERPSGKVSGNFIYSVRWLGCMEEEDQDYLLYPIDSELLKWEARETAASPQAQSLLTTDAFKNKPSFRLKYILRKGRELHLDFVVLGITFPQSGAQEGFPLLLPSSEENDQHDAELAYNALVSKGSNRVWLEEAEIYGGPVKKRYSWSWKHQGWQLRQQETVFTAQSHKVEVRLLITPHSRALKKR